MSVSILPGTDKKSVFYSFMEIGDLVYYTPDGGSTWMFARIEGFTRGYNGTPEEITLSLNNKSFITTSLRNIRY